MLSLQGEPRLHTGGVCLLYRASLAWLQTSLVISLPLRALTAAQAAERRHLRQLAGPIQAVFFGGESLEPPLLVPRTFDGLQPGDAETALGVALLGHSRDRGFPL